jgi:hypothetical protein
MPSSSKPSRTQSTNAMPSSLNGSAMTSIPMPTMLRARRAGRHTRQNVVAYLHQEAHQTSLTRALHRPSPKGLHDISLPSLNPHLAPPFYLAVDLVLCRFPASATLLANHSLAVWQSKGEQTWQGSAIYGHTIPHAFKRVFETAGAFVNCPGFPSYFQNNIFLASLHLFAATGSIADPKSQNMLT